MLKSTLAIDETPLRNAATRHALSVAEAREDCLARASIYRMLSAVFVEEPGREFLDLLRSEQAIGALRDAGLDFGAEFVQTDLDTLVEQLSCEYATLFAASGGFPPVESVRLTGRYKQDPHFQVAQAYARFGFVLQKGRFEVFPDQLGVELMYVAALLECAAAAIERGDATEFRRCEREIMRFWTLHLGRWVRGYCRLIERAAEQPFYREMARLLGGFAEEEIAAMGLRIENLDQGAGVVPKREIQIEFDPKEPECNGCGPQTAASSPDKNVHTLLDLR